MKTHHCYDFLIVMVSLALFFSCSDNSTEPVINVPAELVGTWNATEYVMTNTANPNEQADLIQNGINFTVSIQANGNYLSTVTAPGGQTASEQGNMNVNGNRITIIPDNGGPATATYTLAGETLTIQDDNTQFDFNSDGVLEPASSRIVLEK